MMAATTAAVVAAVVAVGSAYETNQQQKQAAKDKKEGQAVSAAQMNAEQRDQTRARVREERIRRATIMQQSENTGVGGSSGALGATSALGTGLGATIASSSGAANSARGISVANQKAADHMTSASNWAAFGNMASSIGFTASDLFTSREAAAQTTGKGYQKTTNIFGDD